MKKSFQIWMRALKMEIREHRSSFLVYFILRLLVLIVLILQILNKNYENAFLCILTLFLFILPSFIQVSFKIELPKTLEVIMLLFIFAAEILGEISSFYIIFPMWDTVLHTLNGFLAAAIGFSLVDLLNNSSRLEFKLSPLFMALVAFSFSMTIGVLWEFFEFGMDQFMGMDMQKDTVIHSFQSVLLDTTKSNVPIHVKNIQDVIINGESLGVGGYLDIGLIDTMQDLLVNFIGAIIFCIFGYFYVKSRGKNHFASRFIPRKKRKNKDYLQILKNKQ